MTGEPGKRPVTEEAPNAILTDRRPTPAHDNGAEPEAFELQQVQTCEDNDADYSAPSASSGDEYEVPTPHPGPRPGPLHDHEGQRGIWSRVCRFWNRHIILTVPQKSNRDHFALERTFLAYIRTSTMIAMQGVLVAQLFRLQAPKNKVNHLSFNEVGVPLSVACHCVAVVVALVGASRFWRQQSAISRGKVHAGGWELNLVGILLFMVVVVTLVLTVVILIQTNMSPSAVLDRILTS
ncbi:uncharacterized protein N7515_002001 [Penicillium bovifimosum]|uniref:DUF202 domain-containing protein n=1 Tax=Penicillium bovifimosum TaxID=126998 RepID=A0A9W9HAT3_9EURO|nr:uncharacterized protein N7515_002001 [Penicillium bovifimosum]KAJ5143214.1 hypothetical protein N7515_002001 [Penicillium bovifimosum]